MHLTCHCSGTKRTRKTSLQPSSCTRCGLQGATAKKASANEEKLLCKPLIMHLPAYNWVCEYALVCIGLARKGCANRLQGRTTRDLELLRARKGAEGLPAANTQPSCKRRHNFSHCKEKGCKDRLQGAQGAVQGRLYTVQGLQKVQARPVANMTT